MQVRLDDPAREPAGMPPTGGRFHVPPRAAALGLLALAIVLGAQALRTQLGLALSLEALQAWARNLGWAAPTAFVALVTCRQLVLLPAALLLTVGGVVFGAFSAHCSAAPASSARRSETSRAPDTSGPRPSRVGS